MNNLKVIFDLNSNKTVFINPDEIISITPVLLVGADDKEGSLINMRFGRTYKIAQTPKELSESISGKTDDSLSA
jgi:hypothetical protein